MAGQDDTILPVEETQWGPILHRNEDGSQLPTSEIALTRSPNSRYASTAVAGGTR